MTKKQVTDIQLIEALKVETLNAILKGQKKMVIQLYKKVESHFIYGNAYIQSIIANIFIIPISQMLEGNYSWGHEYLHQFPSHIKAEYYRQINSSGI